jgi:hypothetical protein
MSDWDASLTTQLEEALKRIEELEQYKRDAWQVQQADVRRIEELERALLAYRIAVGRTPTITVDEADEIARAVLEKKP